MLDLVFTQAGAIAAAVGDGDHPLVVMPFIDPTLAVRSATQLARRAGMRGTLLAVEDTDRIGFIAVVNSIFRTTPAPALAYVAQDAFAGRDWLALAMAARPAQGGLVAFHDGKWNGALAAFGLVDSGWARGNYAGDLFFPGYRRHYADVELTLLAQASGRLRHDPSAVLIEVDWNKEAAGVDAGDRALFQSRAVTGFGDRIADPVLRSRFG